MIERLIKNTKVYKELERETNNFDKECAIKAQKIRSLTEELSQCKNEIKSLTVAVDLKEKSRRELAGKVGGLTTKNNQLNKTVKELTSQLNDAQKELAKKDKLLEQASRKVEFWKNHKQDTSPFAIQNYFSGAKRKQK